MKINVRRNVRKMGVFLVAIILYYMVREGAHLLYMLKLGVFRRVASTRLGVQIATYREQMSGMQTTVSCALGAAVTFVAGWLLIFLMPRILGNRYLLLRAVTFYVTIVFLLNDFVYLPVLYPCMGGGNMDGTKLTVPEGAAKILAGVILAVYLVVIARYVHLVHGDRFVSG